MQIISGETGDAGMNNKTVLITGAGSGIGEAASLLFASRHARVAVLDVDGEQAERVRAAIVREGGEAIAIQADVGSEPDMMRAVAETNARFGSLDVLVNNAAVQIMGALHECTEAQIDTMLRVNVKGMALGCKHALPIMMERRKGVILSVSSVLGVVGDPDLGVYGATKGAMLAMTRSIAVAYGPYGIRANCVCPGDVNTPMVKQYFDFQPDPEQAREQVNRHYPLRRIAEPAEVARALAFLASDEASFVSGGPLFVDGGLLSSVY
ncbi:MAG: short-chain dehydrogenase/reductase [Paenibacillus sp.]|nr:short-chain dehydrogenase/reductase [Paenibacillus sp.]